MRINDKKNEKDQSLNPWLWSILTGMVLISGILAFAAWAFDITIIKHPFKGWVAMNPTTALCFVLSALSLGFLADNNKKAHKQKVGIFLAYIVLAVGFIKLCSLIIGIDIPVDSLIFSNKMNHDIVGNFSNRMAPNTSLGFLITGVGLLFLKGESVKTKMYPHYAALLIGILSLLSLLGYLFNVAPFYGFMTYIPMAFQTAFCFLMMALALFFVEPEKGFLNEITGNRSGAILARKLIPAVIIIPVVLGLLRTHIINTGLVSREIAVTLGVSVYILIFLVLVMIITYELNRKDAVQQGIEDTLRNSLQEVSEYKNELQNQSQAISQTNAIIEFDIEGNILAANENFLNLFGYSLDEIKGKHHRILLMQEQANTIEDQHFWEDMKMGEFHIGEFERKTKEGKTIWISGSYNKVYDVEGRIVKVLKIVRDITVRKNLETEIKQFNESLQETVRKKTKEAIEKERQYRFLLQNMREGIQVIGFDWRYVYVNNSAVTQSKFSGKELLGHTMMEKYPGIENTDMFKTLQTCMKERVAKIIENDFFFPDGTKECFELSIQPVPEGLFILSMDITARKKSQEKLAEYTASLKSSNKELERFAYVASHDLQEPLRMVSSFLNLLEVRLEDKLDETDRRYINFAVDGAKRMKTLIQDLLLYSRVGTNKENFVLVNLNVVMEYVKKVLEVEINKTHAVIKVNPLPAIKLNSSLINQLFVNLITNALKYHDQNPPEIEIGCNEDREKWVFYVKDDGIGIDPKFFEKIFVIFQRLHSKSEYSGTGIGLAICKKIIDIHKGKIWVESLPEKGSTFYFTIPKIKNTK
ncbi:MAG: PAS domain S-box protein [Ginsengibacter sp.]